MAIDPISLILMAIAAGASKGLQEIGSSAIGDAYKALKKYLQTKFASNQTSTLALNKYEEKPETSEAPLKDALIEIEANKDETLIRLAHKVMELSDVESAKAGKYNTVINGKVQGWVQGNYGDVTMNFMDEPTTTPSSEDT